MVLNTPPAEIVAKLNPTLYSFNKLAENTQISPWFYSINMVKPDLINIPGIKFALPGVLVLLSALIQFLSSKMMMAENPTKADPDDVMASTSEQMIYVSHHDHYFCLPISGGSCSLLDSVFLGIGVQQYFATGWGGLTPWIKRLGLLK